MSVGRGASGAQPAAPGGAEFFTEPPQTEHNSPKFQIFNIFRSCKNCAGKSTFQHGGFSSFSNFPVGRMLHLIDPGHHHNIIDLQKIRVRGATVHVSRNSMLNDRELSTPCRPIDRKATLGLVLLYKLTALRII